MPTAAEVKSIFEALEQGDRTKFFSNVADDVDWTVKGELIYAVGIEAVMLWRGGSRYRLPITHHCNNISQRYLLQDFGSL